jgi:hypothetical protein
MHFIQEDATTNAATKIIMRTLENVEPEFTLLFQIVLNVLGNA